MSECFRNEKICQQKHRSNWKTIIYALGAAGCSALSLTTSALDEDEALGDAYAILITGGLRLGRARRPGTAHRAARPWTSSSVVLNVVIHHVLNHISRQCCVKHLMSSCFTAPLIKPVSQPVRQLLPSITCDY
jgi:hypothetical protein